MEIDHVVLWVEDATRALSFYVDVVGLPAVRADDFAAGRAPFPSVRVSAASILDLMPRAGVSLVRRVTGEAAPTGAGQAMNHLCLAMSRAELGALASRLRAKDVAMHATGGRSFGARGWTTEWFYFQDPDGNVVEARAYPDPEPA